MPTGCIGVDFTKIKGNEESEDNKGSKVYGTISIKEIPEELVNKQNIKVGDVTPFTRMKVVE